MHGWPKVSAKVPETSLGSKRENSLRVTVSGSIHVSADGAYDQFPWLYSRNEHRIVKQLYPNESLKSKKYLSLLKSCSQSYPLFGHAATADCWVFFVFPGTAAPSLYTGLTGRVAGTLKVLEQVVGGLLAHVCSCSSSCFCVCKMGEEG